MRNATLLVAIVVACAISWQVGAQEKWSVIPGAVSKLDKRQFPDNKPRVTGTFSFEADNAQGIASNRLGGACLVADLTAQNIGKKRCNTDLDCKPVLGVDQRLGRPPAVTPYPTFYGYCRSSLERGGQGLGSDPLRPGSNPKICWVRPGNQADYCLTSLQTKGPLEIKEYKLPVVKQDPTGKGLPVRWRILSCLNPPTPSPLPEGYKQPCSDPASNNKQSNDGPIRH